MTIPDGAKPPYMTVRNRPEPRWWREDGLETGGEHGHWHSDARPGPGIVVHVAPEGISITGLPGLLSPREIRWLSARMAEAMGIYEVVFGGDGTPLDGKAESWVMFPPPEPDPIDRRLRRAPLAEILEGIVEET